AAMWTVQKMARDQEISAAQVAGVSLHRLMVPVLAVGVLVSIGLWTIRQEVLPRLAITHHDYEWLIRGRTGALVDGPLVLRGSAGNRFSIQTYDPTAKLARGVSFRSVDLTRSADFPAIRWSDENARWETALPGVAAAPLPVATDLLPRDIEVDGRGLRFLD